MNYPPEVTGIGPMTGQLAQHLVEDSETEVTVLTAFPHYPQWRFAGRQPLRATEVQGLVRVIRHKVYLPRTRTAIQRILYDTSIALMSGLSAVRESRPDLVIVVSPPLQLAVVAVLWAKCRSVPVILHVQDLVPNAGIAIGMIREGKMSRLAVRMARWAYIHATVVSVISEGFADELVPLSLPATKLRVIPNWVSDDGVCGAEPSAAFRQACGAFDQDYVIAHTGNMGYKQGLDTVIDAAASLNSADKVRFVIVGDGAARPHLVQRAAGISTISILPLQEDLGGTLASCDALLLCQRPEVIEAVAPSKLLTYMASGKPIIVSANSKSEAARLVARYRCGVQVDPGDPDGLVRAAVHLRANPGLALELGARGKEAAQRGFGRQAIMAEWDRMIDALLPRPSPLEPL